MSETPKEPDTTALVRAIRIGFAVIVAGVSYPNIRVALILPSFDQMYRDMLGDGAVLPALTSFVIHARPFLIATSILVPLVAIVVVFTSSTVRSIYVSILLIIAALAQLFITEYALWMPLTGIIQGTQTP